MKNDFISNQIWNELKKIQSELEKKKIMKLNRFQTYYKSELVGATDGDWKSASTAQYHVKFAIS